jgi:hypothetical protein
VGMGIMVLIAIMGLIMMACCNNIATYCAAQVGPIYIPLLDSWCADCFQGLLHSWPHRCHILRRCPDL